MRADEIKVQQDVHIPLEQFKSLFTYKVYESYKPSNLSQVREYLKYLTSNDTSIKKPADLEKYLNKKENTKFPPYIDQSKILTFDGNFESGNLDSAYLVNINEYNLLTKVDTNTTGNTLWFYFKVLRWKAGSTTTFNILNLARDLSPFYNSNPGMQVVFRTESEDGRFSSPWRCDKKICEVIKF